MSAVRMWLGPTGIGKSTRVVDELEKETRENPVGSPMFWVVPDDVAFAAEQMLMARMPSVLRAEVITLPRLAQRIFDTVGGNRLQTINSTGKRLLLASAYQEMRDSLGPLKRVQANSGFYQMLLDTFDEMTEYQVNLGALQGALESAAASLEGETPKPQLAAGRSLIGKLRDLCRLYVRYRALLEERSFFDPAMNLTQAAHSVHRVSWMADATFYVDGFQLVSPQQNALLVELARYAKQCTVAFSLPHREVDEPSLFSEEIPELAWPRLAPLWALLPRLQQSDYRHVPGVAYSYWQFLSALETALIPYTVDVFQEDTRLSKQPFTAVERLLRTGSDAGTDSVEDGALRLWRASSDEAEVNQVAKFIAEAVEKKQVDYRDFAVIVPSLSDFGPRLQSVFTRYGIPHAIDEFPPLAAHPLGRFCLASLRLVTENVSADAVARFLRAEYCGLSEVEADWFDIYVRTYGAVGYDTWFNLETWTFAQQTYGNRDGEGRHRDDERADVIRKRLCRALGPFLQALDKAILTPADMAHALWNLFCAVDAKARVAAQVVSEDVDNHPLQASQHEQVWQQVVGLLNDLATVHSDAPFLREELFEMVTDAFLTQSQSTIPSGVDQVFISAYSRAHMWKRQNVFVLGLDEKSLPANVSTSSLLQDEEREMFAQLFGTPVGWTTVEQLAIDRVVPYMLLTRSTKTLVLSYADYRGSTQQQPSPYFIRLAARSSQGVENVALDEGPDPEAEGQPVMHSAVALDFIVRHLALAQSSGNALTALDVPQIRDSVAWFMQSSPRRESLFRGVRGFFHGLPTDQLNKDLALQLYGTPLQTSVHRLETYAACPYRYYLRYGLGIEPLVFDTMQAADVGNLLHDTVFALVDAERQGQLFMQEATLNDVLTFAEKVFTEQLESPHHAVFRSRASRHARLADLATYVQTVAEVLWLHAKQSSFTPSELEWSFGLQDDMAEAFTVSLPGGGEVKLRGRVDRIDLFSDGEETWFRIIDYKSGANHRIDVTKLYFGLQLQLMIYAAVVQAHLGPEAVQPAGVFYMPLLGQPSISAVPADQVEAKANLKKVFRPQGYMQGHPAAIEAMDHDLPTGKSELFMEVYKQDGTFRKTAKVWSREEWDALLKFTVTRVQEIAEELTSGKIPVRPYLYAHRDRACTTCDFAAICHFEPTDHAMAYQVISPKRLEDILTHQVMQGGDPE